MFHSAKVFEALDDAGAVLIRQKKHLIYRFPNGRRLAISRTPSRRGSELHALRDIARVRGL